MSSPADAGSHDRNVKASVIVPCAGDLAELSELVDSLLRQDVGFAWETVFVDNGLEPPALNRLRKQARRLVRTRIVTERRRGIGPARNAGVAAAIGEVVAFTDADDAVASGWLQALVDAVDPGWIAAGFLDLERLNTPWLARTRGTHEPGSLYYCEGIFPVPPGGNMAVSRDDFARIGGFAVDNRSLEDFDFALRAWELGLNVRAAGVGACVHYRLRSSARSLYQQGVRYGEARSRTYAELHRRGLVRRWTVQGWRSWVKLLANIPGALVQQHQRGVLAWIAGNRIGRVVGSVRYRVVYL